MATSDILSMLPTQIENNTNKEEILEAIEEPNLPLSLDSGASEHLILDSGASKTWSGLYDSRSQGNSEIWITEFKNEFKRLLLIGPLQQREHIANQFIIYPRLTTHERPEQSTVTRTRIILEDNSTHTVDISNGYLHLPVRAEQRRAIYAPLYCHIHGQQGSLNANQCRHESVYRRPW